SLPIPDHFVSVMRATNPVIGNRTALAMLVASVVGACLYQTQPFPANPMLFLIRAERPMVYASIYWSYTGMLFTTPFLLASSLLSLLYVFGTKIQVQRSAGKLPRYVPAGERKELYLTIGEVHHRTHLGASEYPQWLEIPERGLYTGIM